MLWSKIMSSAARITLCWLIGGLALLGGAMLLDGAGTDWAERSRLLRGVYPLQSTLNAFGHAGTTVLLGAVLLFVFRARNAVALLTIAGLLEGFVSHVVKWSVGRVRPWRGSGPFVFHHFQGGPLGWLWDTGNPSFPSGHTGVAFLNAAILSMLFPRGRVYFFILATLAAMTRVVQGAHWLSDIVGGAICALLVVKIVDAGLRRRGMTPETNLALPPAARAWLWRRRNGLALAGVTTLVFIAAINADPIVTSHEARVALTAQTMADSGWPWRSATVRATLAGKENEPPLTVNPWVIPVFEGGVRLQKPPLPYWCAAIWMRLIGPGEWAARLTPALLGALSIPLLIDLARRTSGPGAARVVGWLWIATYAISSNFRRAMADPYLSFFVLAAIVAWIRASFSASSPRASNRWIIVFWLALALGGIGKGPVVLLHVGIALAALAVAGQLRRAGSMGVHLLGVALLLLICLPWPMAVVRTVPHAIAIWRYESVGEFVDNLRNPRPWWFYLATIFQVTLPWIAFCVVGALLTSRQRRKWFAPVWIVLTVLVFSFAHNKKAAYLLPTMPAVALLGAQGVVAIAAMLRHPRGKRETGAAVVQISGAIIAACAGVAIAVLALRAGRGQTPSAANWVIIGRITVALAAVTFGLIPLLRAAREHRRWLAIQAASVAVLIALLLMISGVYAREQRPLLAFDRGEQARFTPLVTALFGDRYARARRELARPATTAPAAPASGRASSAR
ncbi:MAG: hypothetical protein QOF78_445 [Phycisphaerales bacterium]|jgi:4-amino-4-deoxy-L-arabinose transferase-like glycosyltransferase/membrane-associated phospholipid phosphatase|nr:hypothetical protein [Phycisphaerales bacterium]